MVKVPEDWVCLKCSKGGGSIQVAPRECKKKLASGKIKRYRYYYYFHRAVGGRGSPCHLGKTPPDFMKKNSSNR